MSVVGILRIEGITTTNIGGKSIQAMNVMKLHWNNLISCFLIIWNFYNSAVYAEKDFQLVDLSHVFDNDTIYWVTQPSLVLNVTHNGTSEGKNFWYQSDEIYAATHGGTHLDAPCHFAKGRWCVSDIPLERLVVPGVVVDISHYVNGNPDIHLTKNMLVQWEEMNGRIPEESLLLVYTGWSQYWPDRLKYTGTMEKDPSLLKFPSIEVEVAEWLVNERSVVGVGVDTMSVDTPKVGSATHVKLMENNIYGLENVNNLDELPPTGATIYVMPMKLKNASGAPCRIVAYIQTAYNNSRNNTLCWFSVLITLFITVILALRL